MKTTTSAPAMAKRVLLSALVGFLAAAVLVDPVITVLYQHYMVHNDYWLTIGPLEAAEALLVRSPGMAILGAIIASPLIAIAAATGIVFRRSIDRHLLLWTSITPVLVWLFTCAVFALSKDNIWREQHSYFDRLMLEAKGIDNSLFFFAPVAAAMCFAALTRRAAGRGVQPALYAPPATR
jgi:hypothetical protein